MANRRAHGWFPWEVASVALLPSHDAPPTAKRRSSVGE